MIDWLIDFYVVKLWSNIYLNILRTWSSV